MRSTIRTKLAASPPLLMSWALVAAFSTYFCMYAFRKPFAVAKFEGMANLPLLPEMDLKILFILAQVAGYATSKFLGIKVVSEMPSSRRALSIGAFIGIAWFALLLFAVLPRPYNAVALVLNGLPLGMIWGLVFGFLEGRKTSDLLGAGLCASFIVASGFVKSVGKVVMAPVPTPELAADVATGWGVSEYWMPFVTGGVFVPALLFFLWMLSCIPEPSDEDVAERTRRKPMDADERRAFFLAYWPGLTALTAGYVLLTAYRDFRDNFAREIWDALGFAEQPEILTTAELPVAFGSLLAVALMVGIRDNRHALAVVHGMMIGGAVLVAAATAGFQAGVVGPATWMVCVGLGLYLGYVPVNCVLFDRLIAAVGQAATAGFLIYVADASGYLGSSALLLYKTFGATDLSWLSFFIGFSWIMAAGCAVLFVVSMVDIHRRTRPS